MSVRTYRDKQGVDTQPTVMYADVGKSSQHRCDRCGAQAFVVATKSPDLTLLFCGHHGNKFMSALTAAGWFLVDRTDLINKDASPSSHKE